jgi:hypothetical protein
VHSLTSALDGGEWSALRPGHFIPRERAPGPQGWSGRGGEDENSHPLPGLEPPIIQPVAKRYMTELSRLVRHDKEIKNLRGGGGGADCSAR